MRRAARPPVVAAHPARRKGGEGEHEPRHEAQKHKPH